MISNSIQTKLKVGISFLLFCLLGCTNINPRPVNVLLAMEGGFSHDRYKAVLERYVDNQGRVDYIGLKNQADDLALYYDSIMRYSPDSHPELFPDKSHELAYWINAYNAGAINIVVTHYPIDSVLDVKNPTLLFFLPR